MPDLEWIGGRILLSNKRLVLASNEGKRTIPLASVQSITSRQDAAKPLAKVSNYITLKTGGDVEHLAVEGGVVRDTGWEKGQLKIEEASVALALTSGQFVEVEIDEVGTVETTETEVMGETRTVAEVSHTQEATAVETHVSGVGRQVTVLASLLRRGEEKNTTDVDLSEQESEVLMALYSGVSPFQIPEFVGIDVDTVEGIFDGLTEEGILEEQRTRREVELKARGRHIASEATDEE
ncbi:MAG: chemotaxis protein CheF1 [Halobacteriales archaeon SW_9_67_25]|nr:MAG: chemotaxis protein CheF1 [Halobacteriales archaeon SW_9_67_25]